MAADPAGPDPAEFAVSPALLEARAAEVARLRRLRGDYQRAITSIDRELRRLGEVAPRRPPDGTFALLVRYAASRPPGSPPMTPREGLRWLTAHGWKSSSVDRQQAVNTGMARLCEPPDPAFRNTGWGKYRRADEPAGPEERTG